MEGNGRQVTSVIAPRSQVHDWVQGQVHAFEYEVERSKLPFFRECVGIGGQGWKMQEKGEGVKNIYNSSRGKKPHLLQHNRQNIPETDLWVFVYTVLPPWNLFSPLSLRKDLLFLQVQVLPLTISASNTSQPSLSTCLDLRLSTLCKTFNLYNNSFFSYRCLL